MSGANRYVVSAVGSIFLASTNCSALARIWLRLVSMRVQTGRVALDMEMVMKFSWFKWVF